MFAIVFSETGLLVGFFLPGDSLLFAAGFLATVLAANFLATGLAVFLAAWTAFFAVFLAATKRSSLVPPGPGKAGLYSLPDPQQQPWGPAPFSPGVNGSKVRSDEHGPPCAVRNLSGTWRGAASGRRPSTTCDQRPILHKSGLHANWLKMTA